MFPNKIIKKIGVFTDRITLSGNIFARAETTTTTTEKKDTTVTIPVESNQVIKKTIVEQLGWVRSDINRCGGYYLEPAYDFSNELSNLHLIQYSSSGPTLFLLYMAPRS